MEHRGRGKLYRQWTVLDLGLLAKVLARPWVAIGAAATVVIANLLPTGELPICLCLVMNLTGLPCPLCGMTRATLLAARLQPALALRYHPFVPAVWVLILGLAAIELLPSRLRALVLAALTRHVVLVQAIALAFLLALGAFGFARLVQFLARPADLSWLVPRWTLVKLLFALRPA